MEALKQPRRRLDLRDRLRTLALCVVALTACDNSPVLPALATSFPLEGQTIARTAWLQVGFATAINASSQKRIRIFCDGVQVQRKTHLLDDSTVVVQPVAPLPAPATCLLRANTVNGLEVVNFQTAAPGAAFATVHDRRDVDRPLPFPDDVFLTPDASQVTGWRPDFAGRLPLPGGTAQSYIHNMADSVAAESDGWSPVGQMTVELTGSAGNGSLPLDRDASVDPLSTVALLDLTPGSASFGERVPFEVIPRSDTIAGQPTVYVLVVKAGIALEPEGTYGLVVTDRVESAAGEPLAPSAFFAAALAPAQVGEDPEITETRTRMEEVLAVAEMLSPVPIPRSDVVLAARITIRSTQHFIDDPLAMRQDVLAGSPNVVITAVNPGIPPNVAAIVEGTFDAPDWSNGLGYLERDAQGLPMQVGTVTIPFILALPADAWTNGNAPLIMYQHGNPGSAENEVPGASAEFMAAEGFAVAGFTDPSNRSFPDVETQFTNFFTLLILAGTGPELYLRTYGEQMAFFQALQSLDTLDVLPLGAPDGLPDLDTSVISYEGISYGSTHAQAFLAYEPGIASAALVAGAGRLAELLEYQDRTRPNGIAFLTEFVANVDGSRIADIWMGLSLFANTYDHQEPHNHARFIYREPATVDGTTQKASILVVEGIDDSFTANNSTRALARQLGLTADEGIPQLATPFIPVNDLAEQAGPIQSNIDATTTAAMVQYAPVGSAAGPSAGCEFETEGHFCAQTAPGARAQRIRLYQSALVDTPVID